MPVNPDRQSISGVLAYKNIESLPVTPDLAILTVPLEQTPALISQQGARGTRGGAADQPGNIAGPSRRPARLAQPNVATKPP